MTFVGAFATSDLGSDLMVVVSIHRPPRDTVKLCRLSDGCCFSLSPSRVSVLENGCSAFEEHMHETVNAFKLANSRVPLQPSVGADYTQPLIMEYIGIMKMESANYRLMPLTTYIIQREFKLSYFPSYTQIDCWRHVVYRCEFYGIASPTLKVVRARLAKFAVQRAPAFFSPYRV